MIVATVPMKIAPTANGNRGHPNVGVLGASVRGVVGVKQNSFL